MKDINPRSLKAVQNVVYLPKCHAILYAYYMERISIQSSQNTFIEITNRLSYLVSCKQSDLSYWMFQTPLSDVTTTYLRCMIRFKIICNPLSGTISGGL